MSVQFPTFKGVGLLCVLGLVSCASGTNRVSFEGPFPEGLPSGWEMAYKVAAKDLLHYTKDLSCFEQTFQEDDGKRKILFLSPWSEDSDFEGAGVCGLAVVYEFDSSNQLIERIWQR